MDYTKGVRASAFTPLILFLEIPMVTLPSDPQIENTMEIAVMIEARDGKAVVMTWLNPAALAA